MSKVLSSWSGMRKYLENDMLASSLKGRIRYNCTSYKGMDGTKIIEIFTDDKLFKQFSWETLNSYFLNAVSGNSRRQKKGPITKSEYWDGFVDAMRTIPMPERTEYTSEEFCEALKEYRNQSIADSLESSDHIVKMFALLDRRTGKRTLTSKNEESKQYPDWLQEIYRIRCEAEGLRDDDNNGGAISPLLTDIAVRILKDNSEAFEELAK